MTASEHILKSVYAMDDILLIVWDAANGYQIVNNHSQLDMKNEEPFDGLSSLFALVEEKEQETYRIFMNKIASALPGCENPMPLSENRINVAVHMKKQNDIYSYHKTECFLSRDGQGAVSHMAIVVCELTAEEIYRLQLSQNITNDITPTMFIRAAAELIKQNPGYDYALVQFDVAKFKTINEMYGEAFGDEMLNSFIESLKILCKKDQLYVRLTADVFMILTSYETKEDILSFIDLVNENLLGYKGTSYRLVFGVAFVEDLNLPLRKFGDRAAMARQSIKQNALELVAFYEEAMVSTILSRKFLEDHMHEALKNNEFVMYLQPKFNITTGKVVGAEALTRWIRPDDEVISPGKFIPLFEKNGFITKLDAFIWEQACKTIRGWIDMGVTPLPISVNMSRIHLQHQDFLATLNKLIQKYDIPQSLLEIEITESADNHDIAEAIHALKDSGYTLLMDDFGSGYSSLNTLKDTQFDVIKIDREFLLDFIESQRGKKIVEYTIAMTRSIGLDLVAEGVETKEQAGFLQECGCDVAQGFYYAKPMSVNAFNELLDS